jgi:hypothetical protein
VPQEAADELLRQQACRARLARCAVAIAEDDLARVVAQDGGVGESDAEDVARKLGKGVPASANGLRVNDP